MKKPIVWVGLLCLVIVLVGWPRREESLNADRELVLLCPYGPLVEQVEKVAAAFSSDYPGWRVRVIPAPGRDYYTKALSLLAARQKVDVLWLGLGFAMFSDRGALLNVEEIARNDEGFDFHEFLDEALDLYRTNGELYGLPYAIDAQFYAINPERFAQLNVSLPGPDWTLEEFVEIGRKLTATGAGAQRLYGLGMAEISPLLLGLRVVSAETGRFGLIGREAADWLTLNIELAGEGVLLRSAATGQFDRMNEFISGRVGIMTVYTWELQDLHTRMQGKYLLLPLPQNASNSQRTWASSQGFSITSRTRHPEMAWELLKRLTSANLQRALPRNYIPARRLAFEEYMSSAPEADQAISAVLKSMVPDPRIRNWEKVESEWHYWQDKAFEGQISPQAAIEIARKRIDSILEGDQ